MSFGVIQSMIISLRNNSRRKELSHFDRRNTPPDPLTGDFDNLLKRKASPEQLENIRNTIKREKRRELIITIVLAIIGLSIMLYQFNFVMPLYCCIFTDGKTTRIYYQRKFERA
jgi:hypothetical protein